jgi:hypothetical protein
MDGFVVEWDLGLAVGSNLYQVYLHSTASGALIKGDVLVNGGTWMISASGVFIVTVWKFVGMLWWNMMEEAEGLQFLNRAAEVAPLSLLYSTTFTGLYRVSVGAGGGVYQSIRDPLKIWDHLSSLGGNLLV